MKHALFTLAIVLSMFSCSEDIGKGRDTIKLSSSELFSTAEGGEFVVTTQSKNWNMERMISVDSEFYGMGFDEEGNNCYWPYNGIDFPIETGEDRAYCYYIVKIEGPWFTVHRVTEQKIIFYILPNDTGRTRTLALGLSTLNFSTSLTLTQSAD